MRKDSIKIQPCSSALLLCEGIDEKFFLMWYIDYLSKTDSKFTKIQIIDFGGIKDLKFCLKNISAVENFDKIKRLAIIRDAENDWQSAIESVNNSVKESYIDCNKLSSYLIYLLPGKFNGEWTNGTLEDLCIRILKQDDLTQKILEEDQVFLEKVENIRDIRLKRRHKNLLHSYFSATDDYVGAKIGEAARYGAFDWASKELDEIKCFLECLIADTYV